MSLILKLSDVADDPEIQLVLAALELQTKRAASEVNEDKGE